MKNGAPRCISEFKDEIYQIRSLKDYSNYENNVDRGEGIREKVGAILELLQDEQKLDEEREKAKKIRDSMAGIGGISHGGQSKYQGYSSHDKSIYIYKYIY